MCHTYEANGLQKDQFTAASLSSNQQLHVRGAQVISGKRYFWAIWSEVDIGSRTPVGNQRLFDLHLHMYPYKPRAQTVRDVVTWQTLFSCGHHQYWQSCATEQAPLFSCVVDIISTDRVVPLNKHHCSSRSFDISQCCHAAYTMLCNSVKLGLWSSNSGLILRSGPALKINSHVDCFFKNIQIVYYFKKKLK